jgi:hypothetical protein
MFFSFTRGKLAEPSVCRKKTLSRFRDWNLNPNLSLPLIESVSDLRPKSANQVARRIIAASNIAALCFGVPVEKIKENLYGAEVWTELTDDEKNLFADGVSPLARSKGRWIAESVQFMAWSLGLVDLNHLAECADDLAAKMPKPSDDHSHFITKATLRPFAEIMQEADTLYMLHWRAVESSLHDEPDKRIVLPRISYRRHAADWILGTAETWDEISLDT